MPTDAELLQRYVDQHDEGAFGAIVGRYVGLVHGSACRRLGPRVHLAEDVCQRVFTLLARRAPGLIHHPALGAWLHRCTRNLSLETLRKEHRVEKLAQSVTSISNPSTPPEPSIEWERVRPLLDEAIDRLPESDHEIVLLRYFGGLSFAEAGQWCVSRGTLLAGAPRATRALDRLRGAPQPRDARGGLVRRRGAGGGCEVSLRRRPQYPWPYVSRSGHRGERRPEFCLRE
jgi:RNA polymerase sigma factor (sigma-70 family)